jgi:hypothetical protein
MKRSLSRLSQYLEYYFEVPAKQLRAEAYASAKSYYATRPFGDYGFRVLEFTTYQRSYIAAYRRVYAQRKLAQSTSE